MAAFGGTGAVAQLVAHLLCKQGVRGSSPRRSTQLLSPVPPRPEGSPTFVMARARCFVPGQEAGTLVVHDPAVLRSRLLELATALPFEVTTRPMMGGYIGYADGRVFVSLSTGGFGIKLLPADQERALERPGAVRMQHGPNEPVSKSYITFSAADTRDDDVMLEWLQRAAKTAPMPKAR